MPHPRFDRRRLLFRPIQERRNKVDINRDHVPTDAEPGELSEGALEGIRDTAMRLKQAREAGAARILAFGAHTIKNGLSPILIKLMEDGWLTHLATNGAGIIHDWEFAYLGESSEDVRENLARGDFGAWEETGYYINLAINLGAAEGLGYGESVGKFIEQECLDIPSADSLRQVIQEGLGNNLGQAAAAADMAETISANDLKPGRMRLPHPHKRFSVQAAAYRLGVPFTGHPMIGHDIIYEHPMSCGAAIGRSAERDFLSFVGSVSGLEGGAYISIGSAVMSPMIFEKALSMARNTAHQADSVIKDIHIAVVDLAESSWDWTQGDAPEGDPAYYQRYNKTFSRAGGSLRYIQAHNRDFLLALLRELTTE